MIISPEDSDGIQVEESPGGRKSTMKVGLQKSAKKKNREPLIKCTRGLEVSKGKKGCKAGELCYEDITQFHHHVTSLSKTDQDKFLLRFMQISTPRRRVMNPKKKESVSVKYTIRKKNGVLLPVCAATFQGVSGMSNDRLSYLASRFHQTGKLLNEMRGGDTTGKKQKDITVAIKKNIKKYKCRESHYRRGKSKRGYLPSELTVHKMWKNFCEERKATALKSCSLSKYKRIFYKCFNLSFQTPHTDTCSTCKISLMKIMSEKCLEKNELRTSYGLHNLLAKQFYHLMKEQNPDVVKICFDMQQNQPIPKLSVNEVFYARQVWLYNLCIMIHSEEQRKESIVFYTWLETESLRGCNQVASALQDFLNDLEKKQPNDGPTTIHLFSDSCCSQNKNSIMMTTLIAFLEQSIKFKTILHFFPIRGHSYMAPDRVFGRIEKSYRRRENILSPNEYYGILEEHGTLKVLNRDWKIKDLKESAHKVLKARMPVKMNAQRVLTYEKGQDNVKVRVLVQNTYFGDRVEVDVLKGKTFHETMLKSTVLPKKKVVSKEKKKDVSVLQKYFEIPGDSVDFYRDILEEN